MYMLFCYADCTLDRQNGDMASSASIFRARVSGNKATPSPRVQSFERWENTCGH